MTVATRAGTKRIATHHGTFHFDEALAAHILLQTDKFRNATVVRSRDQAILNAANKVVDVGDTYDPANGRFDHHQRGFAHTFGEMGVKSDTKLSSAGLVYKHFGREVVRNVLAAGGIKPDHGNIESIFIMMYKKFVEAVDAKDNGIARYPGKMRPKFSLSTDLSSRVARLNAACNEPRTPGIQDSNFEKAVALVGSEFDDCILRQAKMWLPAQEIIDKAMASPQV